MARMGVRRSVGVMSGAFGPDVRAAAARTGLGLGGGK